MKYTLFQVRKLIRRIFVLFGWTSFYFKKTGLKCINPIVNYSQNFELSKKTLRAKELYLFVDGLSDEFTLMDKPIINSPHYQLMVDLKNGNSIENNNYILCAAEGKLDMRDEIFFNASYYYERFKKQENNIENNKVSPIKVFLLEEKYYILDGKHRAALFALLNKEIEALIVPTLSDISFFQKTLWHLENSNSNKFNRNIALLKKALNK